MSIIKFDASPKNPATICANCRHFRCEGAIWYDQYCGHPKTQLALGVDPVTGKQGYRQTNDLGTAYFAKRPEPYARDVNNGNCPYFEVER